jgi:hypothetical protein
MMAIGDPGKAEFRNAILEHRNPHIAFGLSRVMDLREEVVTNVDLQTRPGVDTPTKMHFIQILQAADRARRLVTYNPDGDPADLGTLIARAIDPNAEVEIGTNPFSGDEIQMGSSGLYTLPWDLSGADPNIPLLENLTLSNNGVLIVQAVNRAIVTFTRLESRHRDSFLYKNDSLRIYTMYQQVLALLEAVGGPDNQVDFAQVRATDEPRGSANAPNRATETPGGTGSGVK